MYPILIEIGPLSVKSYGLFLALAFLITILLCVKEATKQNIDKNVILSLSVYVIIFSLIFARITYVLLNLSEFKDDVLSIFLPIGGGYAGFSFHGGLVGGILATIFFTKVVRKVSLSPLLLLNISAPYLALGETIARVGCFLNGCCYGHVTNFILGVKFPELHNLHHPAQLYQSFLTFTIFLILLLLRRHKKINIALFFYYLILYSIARFIVEFFRKGATAEVFLFSLTHAQIVSIIGIAVALIMISRITTKNIF